MGILDGIEKLITEHGSAAILRERIALAKDEHAALEKKITALQEENAKLKGENQGLELDNYKLKDKIGNLEKELVQVHGSALEKEAEEIIALLAQAGHSLTLQHIAAKLGVHPTKAEHFLNGLSEQEYVGMSGNYATGQRTFHLYPKGQEYAVKHGFV